MQGVLRKDNRFLFSAFRAHTNQGGSLLRRVVTRFFVNKGKNSAKFLLRCPLFCDMIIIDWYVHMEKMK